MLDCKAFIEDCARQGVGFFTGVPDSLLKEFGAYVMDHLPPRSHVIAANEGGAVGLATGHYLATGKPALVYLQNSGQGNTVNPILSLADPEVYGIPMLLLVGWRGEPGDHDEPQHVKQGRVMNALFHAMEVPHEVLETEPAAAAAQLSRMVALALDGHRPVALVVKKGSFKKYELQAEPAHAYPLNREQVIAMVAGSVPAAAALIGTTGHVSRELYEYRLRKGESHARDFLTVGGMGHASQIALGISMAQPTRPVYCLDGDGAALMHLGGMPLAGQSNCANLRHIVLNNGAHGSVGGQPTLAFKVSLSQIASACGYGWVRSVETMEALQDALEAMKQASAPAFLEVKVSTDARKDLGRPKSSPEDNRKSFMNFLATKAGSQP